MVTVPLAYSVPQEPLMSLLLLSVAPVGEVIPVPGPVIGLAMVSLVIVWVASMALFPAMSDTLAVMVKLPSASSERSMLLTDHEPSACTMAVVLTLPITMVTVWFSSAVVFPAMVTLLTSLALMVSSIITGVVIERVGTCV